MISVIFTLSHPMNKKNKIDDLRVMRVTN